MFHSTTPPKLYDIDTSKLLKKYCSDKYKKAAEELISMVKSGEITFPYRKYFQLDPKIMFANLKSSDLEVTKEIYTLRSYFPTNGLYLPPRFRGSGTIITTGDNTYESVDALSDYFIEDVRLNAKRYDQEYSINEQWKRDEGLEQIFRSVLSKSKITPYSLRDTIYRLFPETQTFSPSWAKATIKLVSGPETAGKKWLDISSGWGDRLISAISLDMIYTGCDPNVDLIPGHTAIIEMFGDKTKHRVIPEPFEKAVLPYDDYDIIFTSPPYFTVEEYVTDQKGQSMVEYPDYNEWMVKFLFTSLSKAWDRLKDGGYLMLHLGDTKTVKIAEPTNIFIEDYLTNSSWEGVIGTKRGGGSPRPIWVWKKSPEKKRWNSFRKRSLAKQYPFLDKGWKREKKETA